MSSTPTSFFWQIPPLSRGLNDKGYIIISRQVKPGQMELAKKQASFNKGCQPGIPDFCICTIPRESWMISVRPGISTIFQKRKNNTFARYL